MRDNLVVAAIDVGGRANIGWAVEKSPGSAAYEMGLGNKSLGELIEKLKDHLSNDRPVALGIESPLYLPIAESENRINSARAGESNRAWSASAGASVAPLGVHQLAYVLSGLQDPLESDKVGFKAGLLDSGPSLMIWEAFVSGSAKGESHEEDASIAIRAFRAKLSDESIQSDLEVDDDDRVINIAAAAVLAVWPDCSSDLASKPCLVVKPG